MLRCITLGALFLVASCQRIAATAGLEGRSDTSAAGVNLVSAEETAEPGSCCSQAAQPAEPAAVSQLTGNTERVRHASPWRTGSSDRGVFTARWRSLPDPIPNNEPFELELWLYRDAECTQPLPGIEVSVKGWMPDHRHGMLRRPRATDNGDGSYRVRGMLLHMGGFWQLHVEARLDSTMDRAVFEVQLP